MTEAAGVATLNQPKGHVTLAAVLGAGAGFSFTLVDSFITATSVILLSVIGSTATAVATRAALTVSLDSQAPGLAVIHVFNPDVAGTPFAPVVNFLVV